MAAFLKILQSILHFLGRVALAVCRGTVKLAKKAAPYIIKGLKYCVKLLEKAMPYILKGLEKLASWIIKLIPKIINGILLAIPLLWKKIKELTQKIKDKRVQRQAERSKVKSKTKEKAKIKENTNNNIKKISNNISKFKEGADNVALEASLAVGALGGAGVAVDAIVNSGQCTAPELALPAVAAGVGTYALHKIRKNKSNKEEKFEEGTKQIVEKVANTKKMALAKKTVSNDR